MKIDTVSMKPERVAVLTAVLSGIVTHAFGLMNVLHNCDDIAQQPKGYGTGITSGRWLLSVLGDFTEAIGGNYNLPVVNGLLFILLIGCSAGLLVSVLRIRNRKMAALVGMLFVVFPAAFSTLTFRYTAVYYGVAILLSVLAVWVLPRCKFGLLLSAFCIAFSMGIYQAYVPITIGIFVLLLLRQTLEETAELGQLVRRSLQYCALLLLGLLVYYGFLQVMLRIYGTELSDYQGVNEMGKISLGNMPKLIRKAVYSVVMLPVKDYCGVATTNLIRIVYLLIAVTSVLLLGYHLLRKTKKSVVLFALLLCAVFPVAVNFIVIMCPDGWVYTIMIYSFVLIPCVPILLFECLPQREGQKKTWRFFAEKGVCCVTAVLICCYAYQTNINYSALYYANRQVENYLNSLVTQVRMTEGFNTDLEWAVIGQIEDPLLGSYWQFEMNYGGIEFTDWLLKRYSWNDWIHNYYGYEIPKASEQRIADLSASEEVKRMPCWPNEGAIKVIGDTVVIKCQEMSNAP